MAVGAAFRANSHDDWLRFPAQSFANAIIFCEHRNIKNVGGTHLPEKSCAYPERVLQDRGLQEVVRIFEANGFIWGGKWFHFDTIHFEYRPELLVAECTCKNRGQ